MKCLITGATGFIGYEIAKKLIELGHEVFSIGQENERPFLGNQLYSGDIIDFELNTPVDVVFHQAAINDTRDMNKQRMFDVNVHSTERLFNKALKLGCKKFVFASSCSVYGDSPAPYAESTTPLNPLNPYADSKLELERISSCFASRSSCNRTPISIVGLRYSNVFGIGEKHKGKRASMIYQIASKMIKGERPELFEFGNQLRDWVHVDDVVEANLLFLDKEISGIFNVGYGKSISFNEIVLIVNQLTNQFIEPAYIPCNFKEAYQSHTALDLSLIEKLGYRPKKTINNLVNEMINNESL